MTQITLRAARVNCGFKLKEVANHCEKSVDTIIKYEKNSSDIPHDMMLRLLILYDVTINDIFFGKLSDFIGHHKARIEATA
jgi:transcriptional regulator with XRE-family HTH domain